LKNKEKRKKEMENYVGIYYVLYTLPVWAIAGILFLITLVAILVGRDILEGLPYNVSYSAVIGDAGLIIGVLITATILQRGGAYIPSWFLNEKMHINIIGLCFLLGLFICFLTLGLRSGQLMDIYHDVIIAPLILYFAITLVPVIYYNGTNIEKWAVIGFIFLWLALVVFDIKYKRMDQRSWLQNHGVTFQKNVSNKIDN
jgi:hypothetical protein